MNGLTVSDQIRTFPESFEISVIFLSVKTMSLVLDCLLDRMEEYTDSMESLVEEMTEDYFNEKKKTENLLYELLPK